MSDPREPDSISGGGARLLDEGADDFERALLRSAKRDRMQPDQKRVLASAIGVGVGSATLLGATKAAAAAKSGAKLGTLAIVKWLGIGLATVAATAGTARLVVEQESREQAAAPVAASPPAPARPGPSLPRGAPVVEAPPVPIVSAEPVPSAPVAPVASAPPVTVAPIERRTPTTPDRANDPAGARAPEEPTTPPVATVAAAASSLATPPSVSAPRPPASHLDEELAWIAKVRAAVDANDAAGALQSLDAYAARFPRGALGEEAELLRVRSVAQTGDRSGARRLAEAFLTRHPASPYAARVRAIAEDK